MVQYTPLYSELAGMLFWSLLLHIILHQVRVNRIFNDSSALLSEVVQSVGSEAVIMFLMWTESLLVPCWSSFISWWRCFRWLLEHGETASSLNTLLEYGSAETLSEAPSAHDDDTTWLIKCNRSEAERMLQGKPEGTFLIRPSSDPHSYALSIVWVDYWPLQL